MRKNASPSRKKIAQIITEADRSITKLQFRGEY